MAEQKKKPVTKQSTGKGSFKETGVKPSQKKPLVKKPATKAPTKKPAAKKPLVKQNESGKVTETVTQNVDAVKEDSKVSLWQKIKNLFL